MEHKNTDLQLTIYVAIQAHSDIDPQLRAQLFSFQHGGIAAARALCVSTAPAVVPRTQLRLW